MRTIGALTVGRSDYGIYRPVFEAIEACPDLTLKVYVSGTHLSPEFGCSAREIEDDGFTIAERVDMLLSSDQPQAVSKSIGIGVVGLAQAFGRSRPDLLLLLGDRFEMLAGAVAALPFVIPMAHIHGGETTEGAFDESIRHAITKMAHLHFVATAAYGARVIQMGESPWRVTVTGAPALDAIRAMTPMSVRELEERFELDLSEAPMLVTYHPVTLEYESSEAQTEELLAALEASGRPVILSSANADPAGRVITRRFQDYAASHANARFVVNFGAEAYFSVMRHAAAVVGNSSSGVIEAASFGLPVVNVGDRQKGRMRGANVIDTDCRRESIGAAIDRALSPAFRSALAALSNPYGDGHAADRIVEVLRRVPLDRALVMKQFHLTQPVHA